MLQRLASRSRSNQSAFSRLSTAFTCSSSSALNSRIRRPTRVMRFATKPDHQSQGMSEVAKKRLAKNPRAALEEAEIDNKPLMDSTVARIIGSDWADRSKQPVPYSMKIYWIIFGLFMVNGVVTMAFGKDESHFVDYAKKKWKYWFGTEEEVSEYVSMASISDDRPVGQPATEEQAQQQQEPQQAEPEQKSESAPGTVSIADQLKQPPVNSAPLTTNPSAIADNSSASVLKPHIRIAPRGANAVVPSFAASRVQYTKATAQEQLERLREKQKALRKELSEGSMREIDVVKRDILLIDLEKAELKDFIKQQ